MGLLRFINITITLLTVTMRVWNPAMEMETMTKCDLGCLTGSFALDNLDI